VNFILKIFKAFFLGMNFALKGFIVYMMIGCFVSLVLGLLNSPINYSIHILGTIVCLTLFTWCCSFSYFLGRIK